MKGEHKGAIELYNQALQIDPNNETTLNSCDALGDSKGAMEDYNQALKISPTYGYAFGGRGYLLVELGDRQEALADFKKAAASYQKAGNLNAYKRVLSEIQILQK